MCVYTYLYIFVYITWCCSYNFKRDLKCPIYSITPEPWLVHHFRGGRRLNQTYLSERAKTQIKKKKNAQISRYVRHRSLFENLFL